MKTKLGTYLAWIASSLVVGAAPGYETLPTREIVSAYNGMNDKLVLMLEIDKSSEVVSNSFSVFSAGWIHSEVAIQPLLDLLCATNAVEPKSASWIPVSVFDWANGNFPENPQCKPYYVVPPTPASAALTWTPISMQRLVDEIDASETGSRRAELLAWVAAARFGTNFLECAASKASQGNEAWIYVSEFAKTNLLNAKPFPLRQFRPRMPAIIVGKYDNMVKELRKRLATAKENADEPELQTIRSALIKLGAETDGTQIGEACYSGLLLPDELK